MRYRLDAFGPTVLPRRRPALAGVHRALGRITRAQLCRNTLRMEATKAGTLIVSTCARDPAYARRVGSSDLRLAQPPLQSWCCETLVAGCRYRYRSCFGRRGRRGLR